MNYLAHFHLAGNQEGFIVGALLGEFVKGPLGTTRFLESNPDSATPRLQYLPAHTLAGIQLHRNIDGYFDRQLTQCSIPLYTPGHRRFLPIALDLFFDYALATHWHHFEENPIADFCERITHTIAQHSNHYSDDARRLAARMQEHSLLINYCRKDFLLQVAQRISLRLPENNKLTATLAEVLEREKEFFPLFESLYPDLYRFADKQREQLIADSNFLFPA